MIVPAKYFLQTIAQDNEAAYPIEVIVLDQRGGGGSYMGDSSEELFRMCGWRSVFECGLVHVGRKDKTFYVELKEDGRMVIDKDILPQKRHMETLEDE